MFRYKVKLGLGVLSMVYAATVVAQSGQPVLSQQGEKKADVVQVQEKQQASKASHKQIDGKGGDPKANYLVRFFVKTCVRHVGKPDVLRKELTDAKVPLIPPRYASQFLGGKPGKAWSATNPVGQFVVAVRDDGVCAVFAKQAKQKDVETLFSSMVHGITQAPYMLAQDKNAMATTPNGPVHTLGYRASAPQAKTALQFTLTTAASPKAPLQAMASLMIVSNKAAKIQK